MKKISLLTISVFFIISCGTYQQITFEEPFNKVYEVPGKTKNQLFLKANNWMVSTFNDAESVIQYSDKEEGAIIGKYLMHGSVSNGLYGVSADGRIFSKINIWVKDGKAKIQIEPVGNWQYDSSGLTIYDYSKEQAITDMEALSEDFFVSLQEETPDF